LHRDAGGRRDRQMPEAVEMQAAFFDKASGQARAMRSFSL
jgi:hypothetical protein